ncbi:HEAT repeat domain-containing protein [Streptacidiphilus jiangxiensis]|uniref:HEAT repeat-containing protein n=1 Tax=Streptacidiphilus jiangxiensis TaxID=235985 RepID=A0A1H7WIE5_STRJI|nr:HEAT repeat domain-containing protein [Streptacidiphilus jiangxiensis]SEM21261.1 HEAT repeat-containing protein [Streptacidiphilus jiangxiensis]
MPGMDRDEDSAERAALRRALDDLDAGLLASAERELGDRRRLAPLVERLRTPAAAFLQPELEQRLAHYVAADDSFARDRIAHALAGACGQEALPALLRARVTDRNEDGDTLERDVIDLFEAWPETALELSMAYTASEDPGLRKVSLWGMCFFDLFGTKYFDLVAEAAGDPDPAVRADVMITLGASFGLGDPARALTIRIAGTSDAAPEVRRAAASSLWFETDEAATDALLACASDADGLVRCWAALALSQRPAHKARAALERLATDEDANVRDVACQALAPPSKWP